MCGIAGFVHLRDKRAVDAQLVAAMGNAIYHRGPDDGNEFITAGVGFAHRRLSIIDVAGSAQPMANEDGKVTLIYNGEIYNFAEVRKELIARGHQFKTSGDTETIVHGYEEWGPACVDRFRGMFAFAIWDEHNETLFLARDRLGIKALYYTMLGDGTLVFGSELKALLAYPGVSRQLNPQAVEDYFAFGYVPEPKSIFNGIHKLQPGHCLSASRAQPQPKLTRYWDFQFGDPDLRSEQALGEELVAQIDEAIRIRLVSEVPLGAFLSGGIDSSAVVARMAHVGDPEHLNTCSISFGDPKFNEADYARMVADRYQTSHRVLQVEPDDFDLLETLGHVYDEPFADPSAIPTYRLCEMTRKHVTVALSGDGGDELLAGYSRYRFHMAESRARNLLPMSIRKPLFGALGAVYPKADWAPKFLRAKTTFQALATDTVSAYLHTVSLMSTALRQEVFSKDFQRSLDGYSAMEVFRMHLSNAPDLDPLSVAQYLDVKTYLPGDILTKVDRASMHHSLEVRVPLLDHKLVEWMAKVPPSLRLRGGEGKYLLKKSMEPHLPNDILYRRKMGFSVPLASWLRGPLRERAQTAINESALTTSGLFDRDALEKMMRQHVAGVRDNSEYLWQVLMFDASWKAINPST